MPVLIYWIALLIMAIVGHSRGRNTWKSSVRRANFIGAREGAAPGAAQPGSAAQPPMQQQSPIQDPPQNAPSQGYATQPTPQGPYQIPQGESRGHENV